jgi:aryl-alcohol dehydrogenase-like predicted oxidoreductase
MTRERIASLPESDWRVQLNPAFKDPHLARCLEVVDLLREIGNRHGRSPAELAIAWTLHHPAVTGAIVGGRNSGQINGFVGALDFRLGDEEYAEIGAALPESIGLLDPD